VTIEPARQVEGERFRGIADVPAEAGSRKQPEVADGERLQVTVIAPVRDEQARGARRFALASSSSDVEQGVVGPTGDGVPAAGAGTDVECQSRFLE
jgi:hypothetical protein